MVGPAECPGLPNPQGQEGVLLRTVIGWSLGMLVILTTLIALQATPVLSWMLP